MNKTNISHQFNALHYLGHIIQRVRTSVKSGLLQKCTIDYKEHTTYHWRADVYFNCYPHSQSRSVYTIHPPFPYMRASYYAIRERAPRNSKGAKAQGISLSNMTGHGRPTHPFFVRIRTARSILPQPLAYLENILMIFIPRPQCISETVFPTPSNTSYGCFRIRY